MTQKHSWATLPNAITLLRLLLVVPIVVLLVEGEQPVLTVVLLVIFGASDWIDGTLARLLGQVSSFGKLFDPLADRIGVVAIVLAMIVAGLLPAWTAIAIPGVELVLLVVYAVARPARIPEASLLGKARTAVMMTGIAAVGFGILPGLGWLGDIGRWITAVGVVMHVVVGVDYFRLMVAGRRRARPRS
ncbi:CDP-alcohol phosphatidyltransferase family protein [Leucobacter sp. VD1]|uniref:CDP-alcohol phosphatidyltransferase family protein n=1 Tax=Leucobacter sp. VD1 TaxID=3080381 RepID=UPI0030192581